MAGEEAHSLGADLAVGCRPIVVAVVGRKEVGPRVDGVCVAVGEGRRIVGVLVGRRGCIGCVRRDCIVWKIERIGGHAGGIADSFLFAEVVGSGCNHLMPGHMVAVVTCSFAGLVR